MGVKETETGGSGMKVVDLGKCGTCGREVETVIDWESFITLAGGVLSVLQVEGHCGVPGHATKVRAVPYDELDELPTWEETN